MAGNKLSYLWAVAGAYLIYLGYKQFAALLSGTASLPVLNAICGIIFVVFGGAVIYREWRNYRRQTTASSDNSQPEEDESQEGEAE